MATNQPAHGYAPPPQGNGIAVASMVLGILSLVLFFIWFLAGILGLLAVIFGALGLGKAKRVGRGKGMAIAGLVTGILGIVLGIVFVVAIVGFVSYMEKTKPSHAEIHLRHLEKKLKIFHLEQSRLPVSAAAMPAGGACATPGGKFQAQPQSDWAADPGWKELGFHIDEDSYHQFRWVQESATRGYAEAIGDLDCDGTPSTQRLDVEVIEGIVRTTLHPATPD